MKATGVVRRIDELGRIVIPKEIRKNFRLKEGENIEIYITDDDSIVLKKYSTLNNINEIANNITLSLNQMTNKNVAITDTNNIISIEGKIKNDIQNSILNNSFIDLLNKRVKIIELNPKTLTITNDLPDLAYIINPLIINGDLIGSIIVFDKKIGNDDIILTDLALKILSKYIEQ